MSFFCSNTFSGISSSKCNLRGDWRSPLGWYLKGTLAQPILTLRTQAAKDSSAGRDKLIHLFNRIEHFFQRLEIYTGITPTTAMINMIVEIMVEVLNILAIATEEVKRGRLSESMLYRFTILN